MDEISDGTIKIPSHKLFYSHLAISLLYELDSDKCIPYIVELTNANIL